MSQYHQAVSMRVAPMSQYHQGIEIYAPMMVCLKTIKLSPCKSSSCVRACLHRCAMRACTHALFVRTCQDHTSTSMPTDPISTMCGLQGGLPCRPRPGAARICPQAAVQSAVARNIRVCERERERERERDGEDGEDGDDVSESRRDSSGSR